MSPVRPKVGVHNTCIAIDTISAAGEWVLRATCIGGTGISDDVL